MNGYSQSASAKHQRGLTYVEVLIATVLMVVALVPAIDALRPAIQGSGIHQSETALHYHLTAGLEDVLARPFGELDVDIRHNTERLNAIIEGWIRQDPGQWLWQHKRWKVHGNPEGWDIPKKLRHLVRRTG